MNATPLQGIKFTARTLAGRIEIRALVEAAQRHGLLRTQKPTKEVKFPRNKTCENR